VGTQSYLIGMGANQRTRWGPPERLLERIAEGNLFLRGVAASREPGHDVTRSREAAKEERGVFVLSRVIASRPVGPGKRSYANAVVLIESDLSPPEMLSHLKGIERAHGRRAGRRWGDRPLDLDIIGWSGGIWASRTLTIPHPAFRQRRFVLGPLVEIAPGWRDPVTHLTARQLLARLDRKRPRA